MGSHTVDLRESGGPEGGENGVPGGRKWGSGGSETGIWDPGNGYLDPWKRENINDVSPR